MDDHFTLSRGLAPPAAGWGVYLARDRLRSLAGGAALPEAPRGVAVLADIAGFTTLTEFLHERHGPRDGAEVLINYTNRVYGCLIGEVERYGGSVIDFAGDAILCWFDGADLSALRRAVAAALAMRDCAPACAGFAPDGWAESVALKISLAAGPVRRMALGNPDIQRMDAIAGTAIDRLADLDRLVRPGAVVADRSSLGVVASELHWDPALPYVIASQPSPVAPPAATPVLPVPQATLLPWVPAPIRRHLGVISWQGCTDWIVCDAWPSKPQACRWSEFFANTTRSQTNPAFKAMTTHEITSQNMGTDLIGEAFQLISPSFVRQLPLASRATGYTRQAIADYLRSRPKGVYDHTSVLTKACQPYMDYQYLNDRGATELLSQTALPGEQWTARLAKVILEVNNQLHVLNPAQRYTGAQQVA